MAVAGLQNVSSFGPNFFGESRPASSVLRMWRELENDHMVNHRHRSRQERNGSVSECSSTMTSVGHGSENGDDISEDSDEIENRGVVEMEHEDSNSVISEQSSDLGESERERVRQIFREWMNSGGNARSSNRFGPGPEWLGEKECGRVRIIREWVQMSAEQRNSFGSNGDGAAEVDSQIDQVRDGMVINHPEIGRRRPIRRLCGRQTLLDLLARSQTDRKKELEDLSRRMAVSDFAHRNRIHALLRGRFLRNQSSIPDKRAPLKAATEIGLLKQRTVSDLREGFLSRLDSFASTSMNNSEEDSPLARQNSVEQEPANKELDGTVANTMPDLEISVDGSRIQRESRARVSEREYPIIENEGGEQEVAFDLGTNRDMEEPVLNTDAAEHGIQADPDSPCSRLDEQINRATIANESVTETENIVYNDATVEVAPQHNELRSDVGVHEGATPIAVFEGNTDEEPDLQNHSGAAEELQESVVDSENSIFQQPARDSFPDIIEDGSHEEMNRSWHEDTTDQLFDEMSGNAAEQDNMVESHEQWPAHDFQEAIDSWLDVPSREVDSSVGRINSLYFPSDENVQSMELRELVSRRRVSSLLGSGFRESLNQVLQSHVERLGHASGDWESDDESSPASVDHEQEQLNANQNMTLPDSPERNQFAPTPTYVAAPEPLWNEDFHSASWAHNNFNQQFGTEWEVINDLRVDMARLHQRMNHMQNMLEACMEMQIELQRTVRQEVSAALNRSTNSKDGTACKDTPVRDESQLDQVRRGICCLCSSSKIDSLLYRCGHMCTCSNCADNLVECDGKCPLCEAPVVEVVRAYFVQ